MLVCYDGDIIVLTFITNVHRNMVSAIVYKHNICLFLIFVKGNTFQSICRHPSGKSIDVTWHERNNTLFFPLTFWQHLFLNITIRNYNWLFHVRPSFLTGERYIALPIYNSPVFIVWTFNLQTQEATMNNVLDSYFHLSLTKDLISCNGDQILDTIRCDWS